MKQFIFNHKFICICLVITALLGYKAFSSWPKHDIFSPQGILDALDVEMPDFTIGNKSIKYANEDIPYDHFEYELKYSKEKSDKILTQFLKLGCDTIQAGVYRRDVFQKSYDYLSEPDRVYSIILVPAEGKAYVRLQGNAANGSEEFAKMQQGFIWGICFGLWLCLLLIIGIVRAIIYLIRRTKK